MSSWRATKIVMREMAVLGIIANAAAAFVVTAFSFGNPFNNHLDHKSLQGFVVCLVVYSIFFGLIGLCSLAVFVVRGAQRSAKTTALALTDASVSRSAWRTAQASWCTIAAFTAAAGASTAGLLSLGVPLVPYNAHSLLMCIFLMLGGIRLISNALKRAKSKQVQVLPASASIISPASAKRTKSPQSRKSKVRRAVLTSVPSTLAPMVAVQYITVARRLRLDSPIPFATFTVGGTVLKTAVALVARVFVTKTRVQGIRNVFFMVAAPIFHVEIQLRMALLCAQPILPLHIACAVLSMIEILMRVMSVGVDLVIIRIERRKLKQATEEFIVRNPHADDTLIRQGILELEEGFQSWKRLHLRVCAASVIAEMAAEYSGIGVVTLFLGILAENASIDLPFTQTRLTSYRLFLSWATQMVFEVVTDSLSVMIEVRLGVPLGETVERDAEHFSRWASGIVSAHASGLCLSSLIVY